MRISIAIEGVTPLMLCRFTEADALASSGGSRGSSAAGERGSPAEIAASRLYYGVGGGLVIFQPMLLRCLVDGGRFHKVGRAQVTTKEQSLLYACLDIEAAEVPLLHKQPWRVDTRAVVIPATKGRILAHRPIFDDWRLDFVADLDTSILGPKLFRSIVDDAGRRVGLGAFRPARKGPYGKFTVVSWSAEEELRAAA